MVDDRGKEGTVPSQSTQFKSKNTISKSPQPKLQNVPIPSLQGSKPPPRVAPRTSLKPLQPAPLAGMIAPESDEFSFLAASLAALECKSSYDFDVSMFSSLQETAVTTPAQRAPPPAAKPPQPEGEETNQIPIPKTTLEALEQRLAKYKKGCQSAQEKGESPRERRMGRIVKQYEEAIRANKTRKPFNYSNLPTPPGFPPIPTPAARPPQLKGEEINPEIPIPKTTLEALEQRLAKYKKGCQSAQEKGESPRERRMGRIVKRYEEAIRANKTRKPFNYSDLPTPPGFPPIPTPAHSKPVRRAPPKPTQSLPVRAAASPSTRPLFQPFKGKKCQLQ